jgi:hypothetical protein
MTGNLLEKTERVAIMGWKTNGGFLIYLLI